MIIPEDIDQRNIIDKLANFVARNGPQFEELTKEKQRGNPKFQFLYGGDHHAYYKWKVQIEGQQLKAQQEPQPTTQVVQQPPVQQSWESDSSAPRQGQGDMQPQAHIQAKPQPPSDLSLSEFDGLLSKLMGSCTKDNIQSGKSWIIANAKSAHHCRHIAEHLLTKVSSERHKFSHMLHIVYLINDVGHHCSRKDLPDLQKALGDVVVSIFAVAQHNESPENKEKVIKVQKIWETNKIFSDKVMEKLQEPEKAYEEYEAKINEGKLLEEQVVRQQQQQQQQQQTGNLTAGQPGFSQSAGDFQQPQFQQQNQFQQWQQQFQQSYGQLGPPPAHFPPGMFPYQYQQPPQLPGRTDGQASQQQDEANLPERSQECSGQDSKESGDLRSENQVKDPKADDKAGDQRDDARSQQFNQGPPPEGFPPQMPPGGMQRFPGAFPPPHGQWGPLGDFSQPPPPFQDPMFPRPGPPGFRHFDYGHQRRPPFPDAGGLGAPQTFDYDHGRAEPDLRQPGPPPEVHDPTVPVAPYHDLPAGLMVPLIQLWDHEYKPLNPNELRLPVPQPPSERLFTAVEAFYSPPSHERPRDSSGWEKNALFEFFKAKLKYIKDKPRNIETVERSPSPPPVIPELMATPIEKPQSRIRSPPRRSRSRSRSRSPYNRRSRSRSKSRSPRRRSRSRSSRRSRSRSPRRSRSRSRSLSQGRGRRSRSRSRSRSVSRSPVRVRAKSPRRSPTPPTGFVMFESKTLETKIEESNVGHQLLKKMGWSGKGLGRVGQGIEEPIKGGDVRDKTDMFKGVGVTLNDPFESYRKNKSYTYNRPRRDRERDRERDRDRDRSDR